MKTRPTNHCPLFASRLQADLLAEMFDEPSLWRDFDDLRRACSVSASTLHAELARLRAAGMIERDGSCRPYLYRPDVASPLTEPVQQLVERTVGVESLIRRALESVDGLEAAAIFGSWARGQALPESDIDVIVVGEVSVAEAAQAVTPVEQQIGRDVNLVVVDRATRSELAGGQFLSHVLATPPIPLVGNLPHSIGHTHE